MLLACLQDSLGDLVSYSNHHAGMIVVARLPEGCDDRAFTYRANQRGASAEALSEHYSAQSAQSGLLLGFCGFTEDEIRSTAAILREEIERELSV